MLAAFGVFVSLVCGTTIGAGALAPLLPAGDSTTGGEAGATFSAELGTVSGDSRATTVGEFPWAADFRASRRPSK